MKKLYALALSALLVPAFAMADATDDQYFDNYAHAEGTVGTKYSGRGIKTMTITTSTGESITVNGTGMTSHEIYADRTDTKLTVKPGDVLTITGTSESNNAEWVHSYVYIDFDNNKRFDVDLESTALNGDLVAFTGYTLESNNKYGADLDTKDPVLMSDGRATDNGNYWNIPTIQLPADMAPGEYRLRYKNDWNSVHPFGRTNETLTGIQQANNGIANAGGVIIDVTLVVEAEPALTFKFNDGCEFVQIYADEELNTLLASSEDKGSEKFEIKESDMPNGLYFVFNTTETKKLDTFTINLEDMDDQVDGNIFHVALDQIPSPEGWEQYVEYYGYPNVLIYVEYKEDLAGIEEVGVDFNSGEVEYFNLQGVRVAADNLSNGVYVARQGEKAVKVLIKK